MLAASSLLKSFIWHKSHFKTAVIRITLHIRDQITLGRKILPVFRLVTKPSSSIILLLPDKWLLLLPWYMYTYPPALTGQHAQPLTISTFSPIQRSSLGQHRITPEDYQTLAGETSVTVFVDSPRSPDTVSDTGWVFQTSNLIDKHLLVEGRL